MKNIFIFKKTSLISFALGFAGVSIMMFLNSLGFHPGLLVKTLLPRHEIKASQSIILPKLEKIKNNFELKKKESLVPIAYGAADFDKSGAYAGVDLETGEVLIDKNLNAKLPIASLTKVMTAVVALDLMDKNELIEIAPEAAYVVPTKIGVVPGEKMRLEELLNAALLTSANDAAEAIRRGVDAKYGEGTFVDAMNEKAKLMGLSGSHFANPQGFDSASNYSSVHDLAVLARYALVNYPLIAKIARKDYQFLPADQNHKQFDLYNWNGLLDVYPATIGLKIGNTPAAGYTTIAVSERGGRKIAAIVLGAPGVLERDLWASQVLDASYSEAGDKPFNVTKDELEAKYKTWKYWN